MNGTRFNMTSSLWLERTANGRLDERTTPVSDFLLPVAIVLVCGTILVLACLIASFLFYRSKKSRMRNKRKSREPELLSYCSTVDSYRTGIIWDFENRRDMRDFLTKVIDTASFISTTKDIFSSLRSTQSGRKAKKAGTRANSSNRRSSAPCGPQSGSKNSIRSSEALCSRSGTGSSCSGAKRSSQGDVRRQESASDVSGEGIQATQSLPEKHSSGGTPIADPVYEEIDSNLELDRDDGRAPDWIYDQTASPLRDGGLVMSTNEWSFYEHTTSSSPEGQSESGVSLWTADQTSSSDSGSRIQADGILGTTPGTLNVLSLSQLSINIRSCPDSPLCWRRSSHDQTVADKSGGAGYGHHDGELPLSFSTTILDMVQGEARKRGLVSDSLVHSAED